MQENIDSSIAIIVSLIALCTTLYKIFLKKGFKREQEYYKKVLMPYIEAYRSRNEKALQDMIKQIKRTDEYIPKYILYLIDISQNQTTQIKMKQVKKTIKINQTIQINNTEDNEKLQKVLIYDYLDIYPNDDNIIGKIESVGVKILIYTMYFAALFFLLSGAAYISVALINIFPMKIGRIFDLSAINSTSGYYLVSGLFYMLIYLIIICATLLINGDRYTTNKKKIEKMIERKIKVYDRKIHKYVY